jgi:hypothetical protein
MFQGEINNLILDQKARRNNNNIELIYDWQINSPSKAAAIVACSYAINGWTVWKNYKGKSLDDMYRKNIDNN